MDNKWCDGLRGFVHEIDHEMHEKHEIKGLLFCGVRDAIDSFYLVGKGRFEASLLSTKQGVAK